MKHASATRSAGANSVISGYQIQGAVRGIGDCRNLVTTDPFCLRKVKKYDHRPQGICAPRSRAMELVVSVQRDNRVLESEPGVLWVSAAVIAMVAFSYWLSTL